MVKVSNSEDLMAKISILYYKKRLNQKEIAEKMGISRPKVSRLLEKAREEGIVKISIENSVADISYKENELAEKFNLREVIICNADDEEPEEERKTRVGRYGLKFLKRIATGDEYLGISAGTTLHNFALQAVGIGQEDFKIVPIIGALADTGLSFNSNEISNILASRLGGKSYLLNAPAYVNDEDTARVIKNEDRIEKIFDLYSRLEIALLGIGRADEGHPLFKGHVSEKVAEKLRNAPLCGSVGPILYDREGNEVTEPFIEGIIGISKEVLLKIPFRVGMAIGDYKKEAVLGAIRGDLINVLITDRPMANWLESQ